jgi:3,4-dihydroxy 2-butanone 4-phosphate synthase/GTP cyclohydrolase II
MNTKDNLDTIEDAIKDIRDGKIIIVVDDENRENEGDFVAAARKVSKEMINFMARHGRGLICAPIVEERCDELGLELMVSKNSAKYETPFTVSVDLISPETSTGISASDRALTVKALANKNTHPDELGKPGHIFPLRAKKGGVLRRSGHTEAAIDLARLAGFEPAGVICEIMNEDGSMARLPQLLKIAEKFDVKLISIEDLIKFRLKNETLIERIVNVDMPTKSGHFELVAYRQITTGQEHLALVKGKWNINEPILVRVHSSCVTGDIFGSCRCDCGAQLEESLKMIEAEGKGIVVYMNQEGRGIGLTNKLKAYKLQEQGFDTIEANIELGFKGDQRDYGIGAQILRDLGVKKIKLLSNNPKKRTGLIGYGLEIVENIPLEIESNVHNYKYLKTKKDKLGHDLKLEKK